MTEPTFNAACDRDGCDQPMTGYDAWGQWCDEHARRRLSVPDLGWHVISGEDLLAMLRRVAAGEDPEMVYIEEYANAEVERVEGDL